jgi:DNA uptake protein ComE-like DNA-binding protein
MKKIPISFEEALIADAQKMAFKMLNQKDNDLPENQDDADHIDVTLPGHELYQQIIKYREKHPKKTKNSPVFPEESATADVQKIVAEMSNQKDNNPSENEDTIDVTLPGPELYQQIIKYREKHPQKIKNPPVAT